MSGALAVILPVFGLIGLGWLARKTGYVTDRTGEGLSDFVFAIAVPALIFRTLTAANLPLVQPWGYWAAYFGGAGVVWTLGSFIAARFWSVQGTERVVAGFTAAQANTALVGIPLILMVYGPEGAVPLFLLVAIHLPLMVATATILAEGQGVRWGRVARQLAVNPLLVAIVASCTARLTGVALPSVAQSVVDALAAAASPCALVTMGIALCRYGIADRPGLAAVLSGLKLVVHPLVVWVLATHVFNVPPAWAGVAVLFAASPCGVNAYLFAERYRTGVALTASAISLSTAFSVLSTAVWLIVLGKG